ncbi:hypothetical protein TNCV_3057051 [Trichonephila clavipes]|nr:hypothetical protein TNCV_3057051 [Trichonephila clavipes]
MMVKPAIDAKLLDHQIQRTSGTVSLSKAKSAPYSIGTSEQKIRHLHVNQAQDASRKTSRREDRHTIRHAHIEPTASLATLQT